MDRILSALDFLFGGVASVILTLALNFDKLHTIGEIVYDRLGGRSLCPEKDDRGGVGGCIELKGVVIRTARYRSDLVKVFGIYERESGLLVTSVSNVE